MTRPLVAVAPARFRPGQIGTWTDSGEAVQSAYLQAMRRAGAIPVALGGPAEADPEELLDPFAGLLLLGGVDVDPSWYGEAPHPRSYGMDADRDRFELGLTRAALEHGQPLLAICRGMQILNVACGGSLWQHLPDLGSGVDHGVPLGNSEPARHPVQVTAGSRLEALVGGADRIDNCVSIHHQAVRRLGHGLVVTGRAADDVVEAIETPPGGPGWCVGVQWHPERNAALDAAQQALFDGFVAECAARAGVARAVAG